MNEELIRQCVADSIYPEDYPDEGGYRTAQEDAAYALRLYHARYVAPLVEVLDEAYGELVADSTRDGARCLLLTQIEKALAAYKKHKGGGE